MKRGRISRVTDSNAKGGRKETGEVTQYSGSSFSSLPSDILVNILLRLSIKWIFISKCVCKAWYNLISDPEFAKLHYDQAQVYALIQRLGSGILYLVEPDKDDFELKLGMCDHNFSKPGCVCDFKVKLTRLEITERNECIKSRIKYCIVNSCNGLLCLHDPYSDDPPIVCNPITGEFINLPEGKKRWDVVQHYGFGFSSATNQYKVIRMFQARSIIGTKISKQTKCEVHILGTKKWKKTSLFNQSMPGLFPSYLNGFLYWFSFGKLSFFDIERERFGTVSGPTGDKRYVSERMGVLRGEVCIFRVFESGAIHVWAMKDCGTENAWSKVFSFDMQTPYYGPFRPIKYLNNGALLLFYSGTEAFIYMDPRKNQLKYLKVRGTKSKVEAIAHIPSFVSLKHALAGQSVKGLDVRSRCAELKLHREAKDIDIVEESDSDYDSVAKDSDIVEEFGSDSDSEFDSDSSSDSV